MMDQRRHWPDAFAEKKTGPTGETPWLETTFDLPFSLPD
jgi:hypothetical protein